MQIDFEKLFSDWEKDELLQPAFGIFERVLEARQVTGQDLAFIFGEVAPIEILLCGLKLKREPTLDEFQSYLEEETSAHREEFIESCMEIFTSRHLSAEDQMIDVKREIDNDLWVSGIDPKDSIDESEDD